MALMFIVAERCLKKKEDEEICRKLAVNSWKRSNKNIHFDMYVNSPMSIKTSANLNQFEISLNFITRYNCIYALNVGSFNWATSSCGNV